MIEPRTAPQVERRYAPRLHRPYAVEFHLDGCTCDDCTRPVDAITPELPIAKLAIAGAIMGNAIAFAYDPAGAWAALSAAVLHMLGMR
ncbi:hypothetical protein [Sphingomonas aquatilis]|uniref:hypothetical protein n=1 Tax=Sphingomonas aquatilis TaxID=93063 RepID=UPI0023F9410A|nr:hypothetical protein [Sphingomonas aquatilis]MCI4653097.1 hypothetical protein [Sphingomonas aquatilis]